MSVFIAMPCYRDVPVPTVISLIETVNALHKFKVPFTISTPAGHSGICGVRNLLAKEFLAGTAEHIFWIDSDMVWTPDDFMRLLTANADVCLASYPYKREPIESYVRVAQPVVMNQDGLMLAESCGLGFTCAKREVMQRLNDTIGPRL